MIVCESTSGLTSRIYVIADAYDMASKFGQELVIIWRKTADCDCSYKMVFSDNQFSNVKCKVYECNQFDFKFSNLKSEFSFRNLAISLREIGIRLVYFIKHTFVYHLYRSKCSIYKNSYVDNNELFDQQKAKGCNCFFEAYNCITGTGKVDNIRFRNQYESIAKKIVGSFVEHCVGVHIRRTDHGPAKAASTTEKFIIRMKKEIENDPEAAFFLATDDWNEQKRMIEIFGKRIITQPDKVLERSSKKGIESSIIDIICLSKTRYILGSSCSIFSKFAADYGNIQLYIV